MELTSDEVMKRLDRKGYLDLDIPKALDLVSAIKRLKKEKKAVLLAHYYQEAEIQELADYLGDSLYLAQAAEKVKTEMIVFAGVHFMAETAKIIVSPFGMESMTLTALLEVHTIVLSALISAEQLM